MGLEAKFASGQARSSGQAEELGATVVRGTE